MGKWHSVCYALNAWVLPKPTGWNINPSVMVLEVGPLEDNGSRRQRPHAWGQCPNKRSERAASYRVWTSWYHDDIIIMTLCLVYNTLSYETDVVLSLYIQDIYKLECISGTLVLLHWIIYCFTLFNFSRLSCSCFDV